MDHKDSQFTDHKPFIKVQSADGEEHTYYSILHEDLPEEILRKARIEVNETEQNKAEGLQKLRKYIKKRNLINIDDDYIIDVLRSCKYNIKKSKVKLTKFIETYRMTFSKLAKYDRNEIAALISEMGFGIFPYRDREGRVLLFCRPFLRICNYNMELLQSAFVAGFYFALRLPMVSLLGVGLITDCTVPEFRLFYPVMRIFTTMTPYALHLPHRVSCIKIVNEHFLGRMLYTICRPFMPDKIKKRVSFPGRGYEEMHKEYPREIMPEEFGGFLCPMNAEIYKERMLDRLKYEIQIVESF